MARKPQPLTLTDPRTVDAEHQFLDNNPRSPLSPLSPLSPTSPKSPRSPFRFSTKKSQIQGAQPMQVPDSHNSRTTLPPPQTSVSLSSLQQYTGASEAPEKEKQQRPARSGFFSNYKASKSSSRLQNAEQVRQVTEDNMSRDTDRPGKVSSQETSRTGTTRSVSSLTFRRKANYTSCQQNLVTDRQPENPLADLRNPTSPLTRLQTPHLHRRIRMR